MSIYPRGGGSIVQVFQESEYSYSRRRGRENEEEQLEKGVHELCKYGIVRRVDAPRSSALVEWMRPGEADAEVPVHALERVTPCKGDRVVFVENCGAGCQFGDYGKLIGLDDEDAIVKSAAPAEDTLKIVDLVKVAKCRPEQK